MQTSTDSPSRLHPELLRGIEDLGFTEPTPIQKSALPPALDGRDLLACAMTGSGKTAAFMLPILQRLRGTKPGTTRALVLTPTRELAAQIVEHTQALAKHTRLRAAAVYGGVSMRPQEQALRRGVDILVACPGRLLDHFQYPYAKLQGLEVLVLDEADRMLDMGFLPDIRRILKHLPKPEQTLFFSATLPPPIVQLSGDLLRDPVQIDVKRRSAPATKIEQAVYPIRHDLKSRLLLTLLDSGSIDNVLVFTRTKHRADRLAKFLDKQGVACDRIHGNRSQGQRTHALNAFKNGRIRVLVATDIAARGIDVEALSHVINFDVPNLPEDYIHRVGRTARAQASGEAFTFVSPQENRDLKAIERAVGGRLERRHLHDFDYDAPQSENLEIPLKERIAQIRARRAEERARAKEKAERKAGRRPGGTAPSASAPKKADRAHGDRDRHDARPPARGGRPATQRRGAVPPKDTHPRGKARPQAADRDRTDDRRPKRASASAGNGERRYDKPRAAAGDRRHHADRPRPEGRRQDRDRPARGSGERRYDKPRAAGDRAPRFDRQDGGRPRSERGRPGSGKASGRPPKAGKSTRPPAKGHRRGRSQDGGHKPRTQREARPAAEPAGAGPADERHPRWFEAVHRRKKVKPPKGDKVIDLDLIRPRNERERDGEAGPRRDERSDRSPVGRARSDRSRGHGPAGSTHTAKDGRERRAPQATHRRPQPDDRPQTGGRQPRRRRQS